MTSPVDAAAERTVLLVWPTVAATAAGRLIGRLLGCLPVKIGPATLSQWLFGPPLAPLGAAVYLWQKAFGVRYRLTDRRLIAEAVLTGRSLDAADLAEVAAFDARPATAGAFFHAGDLILRDAAGTRLLTVRAVPHVENLAERVTEVRAANRAVAAARATIAARR